MPNVVVASSYLRLRRTKIGLGDFKTVKVIGKGAFGEVSPGRVFPRLASQSFARYLICLVRRSALLCRSGCAKRPIPARFTP
jgi:hypothetical protein